MNITLQNLTKRFPARGRRAQGEVTAVEDLSFQIPDGMLVGLLGPSGCGKSTTLNMICGLETPTEGKIFFGEEEGTALAPERRGGGMVFQNYALYPHLTVLQNILFPLENLKGKVFVVTGSLVHFSNRAELKELIESRGGKVTGSVTGKTDYLINNDTASASSKNKKARELGIPVISEEEFLKL